MGSLVLSIQYAKNTGLVLSASELKQLYFTGIRLEDQYGNPISDQTIEFYIEAAQKELQDYLGIKFIRQAIEESRDYMYDDWTQWGFIPTTYPVNSPISLKGYLGDTLQINYPDHWLSSKRQLPDEDLYHRNISLVPVQGGTSLVGGNSVYVGIIPLSGRWGSRTVPNYWTMRYVTGFNKIPKDLLNYVGKKAAIELLLLLGDIITGQPGVTNKSISIDGLSQSVGTSNSSGNPTFGGRIKMYQAELDKSLLHMKARYSGYIMGVLG